MKPNKEKTQAEETLDKLKSKANLSDDLKKVIDQKKAQTGKPFNKTR